VTATEPTLDAGSFWLNGKFDDLLAEHTSIKVLHRAGLAAHHNRRHHQRNWEEDNEERDAYRRE